MPTQLKIDSKSKFVTMLDSHGEIFTELYRFDDVVQSWIHMSTVSGPVGAALRIFTEPVVPADANVSDWSWS